MSLIHLRRHVIDRARHSDDRTMQQRSVRIACRMVPFPRAAPARGYCQGTLSESGEQPRAVPAAMRLSCFRTNLLLDNPALRQHLLRGHSGATAMHALAQTPTHHSETKLRRLNTEYVD